MQVQLKSIRDFVGDVRPIPRPKPGDPQYEATKLRWPNIAVYPTITRERMWGKGANQPIEVDIYRGSHRGSRDAFALSPGQRRTGDLLAATARRQWRYGTIIPTVGIRPIAISSQSRRHTTGHPSAPSTAVHREAKRHNVCAKSASHFYADEMVSAGGKDRASRDAHQGCCARA